jgi:hypothetical protein
MLFNELLLALYFIFLIMEFVSGIIILSHKELVPRNKKSGISFLVMAAFFLIFLRMVTMDSIEPFLAAFAAFYVLVPLIAGLSLLLLKNISNPVRIIIGILLLLPLASLLLFFLPGFSWNV